MRYWDASALIPLVISEPGTALVRGWLRDDPIVVTWTLSRVEIASAIERRVREGVITRPVRREVMSRFSSLWNGWDEVIDVTAVRRRAVGLLARHSLRAADACQLAAALLAAGDEGEHLDFICLDKGLANAAEREGFALLTWS